jgi:hypothetical protein
MDDILIYSAQRCGLLARTARLLFQRNGRRERAVRGVGVHFIVAIREDQAAGGFGYSRSVDDDGRTPDEHASPRVCLQAGRIACDDRIVDQNRNTASSRGRCNAVRAIPGDVAVGYGGDTCSSAASVAEEAVDAIILYGGVIDGDVGLDPRRGLHMDSVLRIIVDETVGDDELGAERGRFEKDSVARLITNFETIDEERGTGLEIDTKGTVYKHSAAFKDHGDTGCVDDERAVLRTKAAVDLDTYGNGSEADVIAAIEAGDYAFVIRLCKRVGNGEAGGREEAIIGIAPALGNVSRER